MSERTTESSSTIRIVEPGATGGIELDNSDGSEIPCGSFIPFTLVGHMRLSDESLQVAHRCRQIAVDTFDKRSRRFDMQIAGMRFDFRASLRKPPRTQGACTGLQAVCCAPQAFGVALLALLANCDGKWRGHLSKERYRACEPRWRVFPIKRPQAFDHGHVDNGLSCEFRLSI